jgi:hypothetical protein
MHVFQDENFDCLVGQNLNIFSPKLRNQIYSIKRISPTWSFDIEGLGTLLSFKLTRNLCPSVGLQVTGT